MGCWILFARPWLLVLGRRAFAAQFSKGGDPDVSSCIFVSSIFQFRSAAGSPELTHSRRRCCPTVGAGSDSDCAADESGTAAFEGRVRRATGKAGRRIARGESLPGRARLLPG